MKAEDQDFERVWNILREDAKYEVKDAFSNACAYIQDQKKHLRFKIWDEKCRMLWEACGEDVADTQTW